MKVTLLAFTTLAAAGSAVAAPIVFSAAAANQAGVQATVDGFRAGLGALNPNTPVSFPGGRRQIDWDAVPDAFADPNAFPGDFFNQNFAPRARGAAFTTPGTGFVVSADDSNPTATPRDFSSIDASYLSTFEAFSPQRMFTALGSNIVDVNFFLPSNPAEAARTHGFGVVFSDVDFTDATSIEYFDRFGNSLGKFFAPSIGGNETFSFLGVIFDSPVVARARITNGTAALGGAENLAQNLDLVVMDDFIFGEPTTVPEPATWSMIGGALLGVALFRRKR